MIDLLYKHLHGVYVRLHCPIGAVVCLKGKKVFEIVTDQKVLDQHFEGIQVIKP